MPAIQKCCYIFRLQQACEKALKSWIHSKGGLAPFTHDLAAMMDWLEESASDVSAFAPIALVVATVVVAAEIP
jgi:HEPN domain-containing protein